MPAKAQHRFWRAARRTFRWLRIGIWLLILALLIALIWLHRVGLPDMLKEPLVAALRDRGINLEFTRMRLIWYRGVVAENIHLGNDDGFRASAQEAELHLDARSLLDRQIDITGIALHRGSMALLVWGTNDQPRELVIDQVNGELRFRPGDRWDLNNLTAEAFGVKLRLVGSVMNASAVQNWHFGGERPQARTLQAFWHDLILQIEQTRFGAPTELFGTISGDAREPQTFRANISIASPAIDSPWGKGRKFRLAAQITPKPGKMLNADLKVIAEDAKTPWGGAAALQLEAQITPSLTQWTPTNAHLKLQLKRAETKWGRAGTLSIDADLRPNPSDITSSLATYSVRGQQVQAPWGRFAQAELMASGVVSSSNAWPSTARTTVKFAGGEVAAGRAASGTLEAALVLPSLEEMRFGDTNVSWRSRLDKVSAQAEAGLAGIVSPRLALSGASWKMAWQAPALRLTEIHTDIYDGTVSGAAVVQADTRGVIADFSTDFDLRKVATLIHSNGQSWTNQITWDKAPKVSGTVRLTLPAWDAPDRWKGTNWRDDVLPGLSLAGAFEVGPASFRSISVLSAQSDIIYSNRVWTLPNLRLVRPEGQAHVAHVTDERAGTYRFVIDSTLDPRVVRPLFNSYVQHIIDDFTLTSPPVVHAELSGLWREPRSIQARATCSVTNGGYRSQPVISARGLLTFTNLVLNIVEPEVVRTEGTGRADSVVIDVPQMKLYINRATGRLDPVAVTKAVGSNVARLMEPYRFIDAPEAEAHGMVDLEDGLRSNLRFVLAGGPFEWRAFRFQQITGIVHWAGTLLTLSNVIGSLHGGQMEASAGFDFTAARGADFGFRTLVHDLNLHTLTEDLGDRTNRLEGSLSGLLVITNANSDDLKSWFGHGNMSLRDGLIWDVPVLGLFSPILNTINPGAGNSRARDATATFIITNSVITTSDLLIYASGMRLHYDGTVDFDARIQGRMEAELLRDMPVLGPLVSKVFWPVTKLFEYKVSGTFSKPKSEPVFIPKVFLMPFHPWRSLRELLGDDKEDGGRREP